MRTVASATCSCGGEVRKDDVTSREEKERGCGRGCCTAAYRCEKCGTRFLFKFEAPEWNPD